MAKPAIADKVAKPADALPRSWVDAAPAAVRPYLRLARMDRPIGSWLLFWPCAFGLALAAPGRLGDWPTLAWFLALFAIGSVVMSGAGCVWNDVTDRDIDAAVERTRGRPLPSGAVSVTQALAFMAALGLIGLLVLLQFDRFSVVLGASSLALVAIYPFMKRITHWPQAVLGLVFNWGALMGWSALEQSLSLAPLLLYAGCVLWTIGYDTIYAHQDKDDDAIVGVKSTALRFGATTKRWLALFYGAAVAAWAYAGAAAGLSPWFFLGLAAVAAHLATQIVRVRIDEPGSCLAVFRSNRETGALLFAALAAVRSGRRIRLMSTYARVKAADLFTPAELERIRHPSDLLGVLCVLHCWGVIAGAMALTAWAWWLFPLAWAVIGSRQLGLAILMHDAAHGILTKSKRLNDVLGRWLLAYPYFTDMRPYRAYHLQHHRRTQQPDDPDLGLSAHFPITKSSFRRKILRDLTGQTAFQQRRAQFAAAFKRGDWTTLGGQLGTNAVLLGICAAAGYWWLYPLLWLLPLFTWFMVVLRIRNIAEHAMVPDDSDPFRNARTTEANWIERAFLAPYWVNYHVEHHLLFWCPAIACRRCTACCWRRGSARSSSSSRATPR